MTSHFSKKKGRAKNSGALNAEKFKSDIERKNYQAGYASVREKESSRVETLVDTRSATPRTPRYALTVPKNRSVRAKDTEQIAAPLAGDVENVAQTKATSEDKQLLSAVGTVLREIEAVRLEARGHDEEIARLGEETRQLITEMLLDLNLRAA